MAKRKREDRSMDTTDHEYKGVEFEITTTPMAPLGARRYTWVAKIGGPIATGDGEYYGETRQEAEDKARRAKEAKIDARQKKSK